jgi:predicted 3-demethylubiquinone-9 3-methyltransferase (glyoxalase superfamily)
MNFYASVFRNSRTLGVTRYDEAGPGPEGTVMSATFELNGQAFMALNGAPVFTFSPAVSFFVNGETQEEVDDLWDKLSDGGEKRQCGWLRDKFGVSWQIVPGMLGELLNDSAPAKAKRVMQAMLRMTRLDITGLKRAYGHP